MIKLRFCTISITTWSWSRMFCQLIIVFFLHFYLYWATYRSFVQFYLAKLWSRTFVQLQILHDFLVLNEIYLYHWMPSPEIFVYTKYYSYLYMAWQYVIFTMQILSSYQPVICRYISMRSLFHFSISSPHSALYISITGELNCWCFNQWAGVISCLTGVSFTWAQP